MKGRCRGWKALLEFLALHRKTRSHVRVSNPTLNYRNETIIVKDDWCRTCGLSGCTQATH